MHTCLKHFILPVICVTFSLAAFGCGDSGKNAQVIERSGQPDYTRTEDNEQLARAVAKAKETYTQLIAALNKPNVQHHGHSVKKPFDAPTHGREHIWIIDVTWDGTAFHGTINNEPVDTQLVKFGDRVEVKPEELSDWMYIDGNRVVGGYTLRVLHYQQSPEKQKQFVEQTGLVVPPVDF